MSEDKFKYTIHYKYRFRLDKKLVEKEQNKYGDFSYVIYHKGKKLLIENLEVQWFEKERITKEQFDEAIKDTKGIIEDSIKGDFLTIVNKDLILDVPLFKKTPITRVDSKEIGKALYGSIKEELKKLLK